MSTHTLETAEADLVYDVHGPLPAADGRPPLLLIGQPMTADGFSTLVSLMPSARSSPTTRAVWAAARARTAGSITTRRCRRRMCTR